MNFDVPKEEEGNSLISAIFGAKIQMIFIFNRTKSMMGEGEYDEFDDYYDDEDDFEDFDGYVNYLRHEFCYDEFAGFGEEYDGPKGILTSFLPDGSSTSPRKTSKNEGQQQKEKNADSGKNIMATLLLQG